MAVTRDISKALLALDERAVISCSTPNILTNTGSISVYSSEVTGSVIDRLGVELGARYRFVDVYAFFRSTKGSTEADKRLSIDVYLQHGTSGSGGDMANYSSGDKATARAMNSTVGSTASYGWSTGAFNVQTNPATWNLDGANRYLRAVVVATQNKAGTTESSGYEGPRISAVMVFREADQLPERVNSTGAFSTTTST